MASRHGRRTGLERADATAGHERTGSTASPTGVLTGGASQDTPAVGKARRLDRPAVPHYARLAWKPPDPGAGGRGTGLGIRKIVDAQTGLADEAGLDGLSIRTLGQRLGFATMAIYRHVRSRDELLVLTVDAALGPPPRVGLDAAIREDGARAWGHGLFGRDRRHPWLLGVPAFGLPATPNHVRRVEAFLATMVASPRPLRHQPEAALLLDGHACHIAHLHPVARDRAADEARHPSSSYPFFAPLLDAGILEGGGGPDFAFRLDRIVLGLATGARPGAAP